MIFCIYWNIVSNLDKYFRRIYVSKKLQSVCKQSHHLFGSSWKRWNAQQLKEIIFPLQGFGNWIWWSKISDWKSREVEQEVTRKKDLSPIRLPRKNQRQQIYH